MKSPELLVPAGDFDHIRTAFDWGLLGELENLANRGYTDGFYQRHHTAEHQNYIQGYSKSNTSLYVRDVVAFNAEKGFAEIEARNKFAVGDKLQIITLLAIKTWWWKRCSIRRVSPYKKLKEVVIL